MNDDETYEEAFQFFYAEYVAEGRNKKSLIRLLRAWPDAAPLIIDEIIEHLENPRKKYLGEYDNIGKMLRDEDILRTFQHGPPPESMHATTSPEDPTMDWSDRSYDEKIAVISKRYPKIKRTYLERLISLTKKQ